MTPMNFANRYLQPYTIKGDELSAKFCPFCSGGKNKDKNTFALNVAKQTYKCLRGSCGAQGHFVELLREFGVERMNEKKYKAPEIKPKRAEDSALEYLKLRGISKATAEKYRVGSDEQGNIVFPYYDESGKHVFNKFRYPRKLKKGEKKAWREAGTMPILFGMDICDKSKPLCLNEGELDAMACFESGIPNAVSVPSGTEDFTWLDTCWDFVQSFEKIYLFGDNDAAGREMVRKLSAKLSDKTLHIVEFEGKDANELLYRQGKEAVFNAWQNAKELPVAGLLNLAHVAPFDARNVKTIKTGIGRLDSETGGFHYGDLSIWQGKRGGGKSTLLSCILLDAVEDSNKVCAYSGELKADRFQYWVDLQAAGKANVSEYYKAAFDKQVYYLEADIREKIHNWYDGRFWLYDNAITLTDESLSILKVFEMAAKRYDCKVFLVDNLMTADDGDEIGEKNFYRQQSKFVGKLKKFASNFNVHVHLAVHPRKTDSALNNDSVMGSGDITNRADNVFAVSRAKDPLAAGFDSSLEILKSRWDGNFATIGMKYDKVSKRIYSPSDEGKRYGWEDVDEFGFFEITEDIQLPWEVD